MAHYGLPSITSNGHGAPVALPDTNPANAYLTCATCHTPHSMYIASANADAPINGLATGKYPSYFFIAAPYNPGSKPTPHAGLFRDAVLPPVPLQWCGWFERSQRNPERHDCFLIGPIFRGGINPLPGFSRRSTDNEIMKHLFCAVLLLITGWSSAGAQVASHAPTLPAAKPAANAAAPSAKNVSMAPAMQVTGKAVAKVNGVVITDKRTAPRDVHHFPLRETAQRVSQGTGTGDSPRRAAR